MDYEVVTSNTLRERIAETRALLDQLTEMADFYEAMVANPAAFSDQAG
jgi:hypothetical protein